MCEEQHTSDSPNEVRGPQVDAGTRATLAGKDELGPERLGTSVDKCGREEVVG